MGRSSQTSEDVMWGCRKSSYLVNTVYSSSSPILEDLTEKILVWWRWTGSGAGRRSSGMWSGVRGKVS